MTVSLFPNWLGDTQERTCHIEGDGITLSSVPVLSGGMVFTPRIERRRAPPHR